MLQAPHSLTSVLAPWSGLDQRPLPQGCFLICKATQASLGLLASHCKTTPPHSSGSSQTQEPAHLQETDSSWARAWRKSTAVRGGLAAHGRQGNEDFRECLFHLSPVHSPGSEEEGVCAGFPCTGASSLCRRKPDVHMNRAAHCGWPLGFFGDQ